MIAKVRSHFSSWHTRSCEDFLHFGSEFRKTSAPQGRRKVAHGASHGSKAPIRKAPAGAKEPLRRACLISGNETAFFRPCGAGVLACRFRRADALGYYLAPLRGLASTLVSTQGEVQP